MGIMGSATPTFVANNTSHVTFSNSASAQALKRCDMRLRHWQEPRDSVEMRWQAMIIFPQQACKDDEIEKITSEIMLE